MLRPKESVRRFDVFAEYNRQEAIRDGMKPEEAKGYGIWLAKVVASKRFGRSSSHATQTKNAPKGKSDVEAPPKGKWHTLDGVPQTDKLFDKEVVQRVGSDFYERVMVPTIKEAIEAGDTYVSIRDKIRRDWKPE